MNPSDSEPDPKRISPVAGEADLRQSAGDEGTTPKGFAERKDGPVPARPGDWSVRREGFDAAGAAKIATESLRDVYGRLSEEGTLSAEEDLWTQVAGAEIAAVGHGRKPVFHEEVLDAAAGMAERLARHFPELHVEAWEGHLIVADRGQLARLGADIADVWEAVQSDGVGVLLGYGVDHWRRGTARVEFFDGTEVPLAGFWTLAEWAEEFARERVRDYEVVFPQVYFEITFRQETGRRG